MRILRLSPAFFLFTLLMSPVPVPEQAYADTLTCCRYGECHWYCMCPGSSPDCPWYPPSSQIAGGVSEIKSVQEAVRVVTTNLEGMETLMGMRVSKCLRDKMTLNLLGNALNSLKFEPVRFDEKILQTVAFIDGR